MPREELLRYYADIVENLLQELLRVNDYNLGAAEAHKLKTNVQPCFFSGALDSGRIVVINLNPKYIEGRAEAEQAWDVTHYHSLHAAHENRYIAYKQMGETLPSTFTNMCRHVAGVNRYHQVRDARRREQFLQRAVLNLDWCYYYSKAFGGNFGEALNARFEQVLNHVLKLLKPKLIYAMGKEFGNSGFITTHTDIDLARPFRNDIQIAGGRKLYKGIYTGLGTPVFYLDYGAGRATDEAGADQINGEFCATIPGLAQWLDATAMAALNDPEVAPL